MIEKIINALRELDPKKIDATNAVILGNNQRVHSLFDQQEALESQAGWIQAENLESLVDYVNLHASYETAVFASLANANIEAVIDWNNPGQTVGGMARHRCKLPIQYTPNWLAWFGINGKRIGQVAFAEFIEEHLNDVAEPAAATLLEVVTTLSGKRNVEFKNAARLSNGDTAIQWEETTAAKAGQSGQLEIPSEITLQIPIFRGMEKETTFKIRTLFRYRIDAGQLLFEIKMLGIEDIRDEAFAAVFGDLKDKLKDTSVFMGSVSKSPIAATTNLQ